MTTLRVLLTVAFCTAVPSLCAQTNDWHAVESLAPGTAISVVKRARQPCELVKVTDSELACDRKIGVDTRRLVFRREDIREIRLEEPERNRMLVGIVAGAAAGELVALLGTARSSDPEARAYARVYGIPIGAFAGGIIGHAIHSHGRVVYRRA